MLRSIGRRSGSWVVRILLVVIIASFALWGVEGIGGGSIPPVAKVDGTPITQEEYLRHFQNALNAVKSREGQDYSIDDAKAEGLHRDIAARLIAIRSVDRKAEGLGLRASDRMVRDYVRNFRSVQTSAGDFDSLSYRDLLRSVNMSASEFEADSRQEIERAQLIDVMRSGVRIPKTMADAFFAFGLEQRAADYFIVFNDRMTGIDRPKKAVLKAYYADHEARFTAPEYRTISFISIRVPDIVNMVEIDDAGVEAAYQERQSEFTKPATRHVKRLRFESAEDASAMAERLAGGLSFDDAADETGQIESEVDLGDVGRDNIVYLGEGTADAIFALEAGGISAPLETDLGTMIFTVDNIKGGKATPLADVAERLRTDLKISQAELMVEDLANLALEELAAGADLSQVASALGLKVVSINSIDRSGLNAYGNLVTEAPTSRAFFDSTFDKLVGEDIDLEETEGGGYFIVRADGITPSALRPYSEVKKDVYEAWLGEAREEKAVAMAQSLRERAAKDEDLNLLAAEVGTFVENAGAVRRTMQGAPQTFSFEIVRSLFEAGEGVAVAGPTALDNGHIVAKVSAVATGDVAAASAEAESLRADLTRSFERDLLLGFEQYLLDEYSPSTNYSVIEQLLTQVQQQ